MKYSPNPGLYGAGRLRDLRKLNPDKGRPHIKVSDEHVKEMIRLHLTEGISGAEIARTCGLTPRTVTQWLSGDNRGHLLLQVQKELEKK